MLFDSIVRSKSRSECRVRAQEHFNKPDLPISSRHLLSREHLTTGPSKTSAAFFVRPELLDVSYALEEKK